MFAIVGFLASQADKARDERAGDAAAAKSERDSSGAPASADAAPEAPAASTTVDPAWYVAHGADVTEMNRAVQNLGEALRAKDGVNIARFSTEVSLPAGDLLASGPPEAVRTLTTTAMKISGAAAEAYISGDYAEVSGLYNLYGPLLAATLEELKANTGGE